MEVLYDDGLLVALEFAFFLIRPFFRVIPGGMKRINDSPFRSPPLE